MNPLLFLVGAGTLALLASSSKSPAPAPVPSPPKGSDKSKAEADAEARAKAEADAQAARDEAEAARSEADAARTEAEAAKADAARAAELQPLKDAILYAASRLGKEPFRVQKVAPSFNGQPIGASILYGANNPKATRSDYELALVILQNERAERMAKGLGLRAEILALKDALAAYGAKLFGALTVLSDTEEKAIEKIVSPTFDCAKVEAYAEPFGYLPATVAGKPAGGLMGKPIGRMVAQYGLQPSATKAAMDLVIAWLSAEAMGRNVAGKSSVQELAILECVKAERVRRFGA